MMGKWNTINLDYTERRLAGRLKCHETKCQFGEVRDLSRTGMKVITRSGMKVPLDSTTNVTIQTAGAQLVIPARVVDNRVRSDGMVETGLAFVVDERWNHAIVAMARIAASNHDAAGL